MTAKREVYVLGGYMTDFARNWTKENKHFSALMRESVIGALERTGIAPEEIESAHVGNFAAEPPRGHPRRSSSGISAFSVTRVAPGAPARRAHRVPRPAQGSRRHRYDLQASSASSR
jgi:acetyl-CoA acetyltransferase